MGCQQGGIALRLRLDFGDGGGDQGLHIQFRILRHAALLHLQHARIHEDKIKPRLQHLGQVDRRAYHRLQPVQRRLHVGKQQRQGLRGVAHHVLDHFGQLVLAGDVAIQAAHRQPRFAAQVAQAHGPEAHVIGQAEGGDEDAFKIFQRRLAAFDADTFRVAVKNIFPDVFTI